VNFDEYFKAKNNTFRGKKILYLELKNDKIKIFIEN